MRDLELALRIASTRERLCWIGAYYAFEALRDLKLIESPLKVD